ncbi:MAG TPA: cobyrinate a,c-diamide synthase [bacterium]|nr:cobyrinate a,c-diamide synthase [bacterium]
MKLPRLLIAAPGSSSGKTCVALLAAAWARKQGLDVRAFKAGPDFIDPQYLSAVTARPVPSLDPWFLPPPALKRHFMRWGAGADLALVEGVMGLYDGKRDEPFGRYSSAEVARTLDLPVLLVLNARKAGPTLATQALGLVRADPRLRFCGVVLNHVSSAKGAVPIASAIKKLTGLPTLGWLPTLRDLDLPERHLGLTAASEMAQWQARLEAALPEAAKNLDFKALLRAAQSARPWSQAAVAEPRTRKPSFRLAVARDEAFHFYYPENLRLWEDLGAELAFFSPLHDTCLPEGVQGLLLGGGFPESFGAALAANVRLMAAVREAIAGGLPFWAECGGLMWLCEHMVDAEGKSHALVGALPATVSMGARLQNFGYTQAQARPGKAWPKGLFLLKGHEFHHSSLVARLPLQSAWTLSQSKRPDRSEGWTRKRGVATYFHAYLPSAPAAAKAFARLCKD